MSKLKVISSGSVGNAYILECGGESLLIELGVKFETIRKALNNDISNVRAAIVSHKHVDHASHIPQAISHGIPVYSCKEVAGIYKGVEILQTGKKSRFGGFLIQPFYVPHSVECYAFLITHKEIGKLWFITDCQKFGITQKHISNVNHMFIECNYSNDIIIDKMCESNKANESMSEFHMELSDTICALKNNYSSELMTIGLLHLSDANSDEQMFFEKVRNELGFTNIFVCTKNMEIPLQLSEF